MPKASAIARYEKQKKKAQNSYKARQELKKKFATDEERINAMFSLDKKRDRSMTRTVNRCGCCKRPRGVYKFFNLCRLCLIKNAALGIIPGLRLSSW
jgi:small subunit ribosomal protein S14